MKLNYEHTGSEVEISELLFTLISKFQLFEPCKYLSEDDDWLNVSMQSTDESDVSQPISILKSELTAFGVFNKDDLKDDLPQKGSEDLYQ